MENDQMKIDPVALENIMALIKIYTSKQKDALNKLTRQIHSLVADWDDERSFGEMSKHIELIDKRCCEMFEQMSAVYCKFYYDEVVDIRKNLGALRV